MVYNFKGLGKKTAWDLNLLGCDSGVLGERFWTIRSNAAIEQQRLKQQEEWLFLDFLGQKWWHYHPSKHSAVPAQRHVVASQNTWIFQQHHRENPSPLKLS
jgi:hypothetical protein